MKGLNSGGRDRAKGTQSEKIDTRRALFFILSFVRRHLSSFLTGIVLLMIVDLIQIMIPRIIQRIVDTLEQTSFSQSLILKNTLFILALASAMVIIRFFWRLFIMGSAIRIEKEVRHDMFSHLQELSFSYFNRTHTGDIMALMINDVNAIRMATGPSFFALTDAIFMGTLSLLSMLSINIKLAILSILPLTIIIFLILKYGPLIQSRFKAVQESFASISSHTQEALSGIRIIKGFVQEKIETRGFEEKCGDYVEKNILLIKIWGFFFPSIALLANLSLAILYLVGGRQVVLNALTFGEFISFTMYINLFVWPVIAIGWVLSLLQRGIASAKRVLELLDEKPDVFESRNVSPSISRINGRIEIKGLTFRYPQSERMVLRDIDLVIPEGESLGIMGKPGSGKTTLVSLLFRLFPIKKGQIFFDGNEIHKVPLEVLRSSIGYVPQDSFLFSDTIKSNILFGLPEDSNDSNEYIRISNLVSIYSEVMEFNKQFDTPVGERGVTLSGGQKQRLSIARALIIKPPILILDDAFSSVDAETEWLILKNLFSERAGKTTIIISHRVSTVKECDNIIILEEGMIRERGNHKTLIASKGYYKNLFELQRLEEKVR